MTAKPYTVYTATTPPKRPRRRWPFVLLAAVLVLGGGLAGWQLLTAPRISALTPKPEAFTKDSSPAVSFDVRGLRSLTHVRVVFNGEDVTESITRHENTVSIHPGHLHDGTYTVAFSAQSSNLFVRHPQKHWRFTVDTVPPKPEIAGEAGKGRVNKSPAVFTGTTEPLSTITVTSGAVKASGTADEHGAYSVEANLPDGPSSVTLEITDRAGNSAEKTYKVYVDAVPPTLEVTKIAKHRKSPSLKIHMRATDQLGKPKLEVILNGKRQRYTGSPENATLKLTGLAEGRHVLEVRASDRGGNVVVKKQSFLIDSTERFGWASMRTGARGKDVKELQAKLITAGVYKGKKTGVYDDATTKAVRKLQTRYNMEADGIVGGTFLAALSGKIVVDLSECRLYLYRGTRLVKTYPVAVGQPAYPTPTGVFSIATKQKDPSWLPPDSGWAAGSKPIAPGINNPLGTRWMGTTASGVGIHGIPPSAAGSIGTHASHGCIRMHNSDAMDLYERVVIGMPVIIRP